MGGRGSDRLYGRAGAHSFSVRAENFGQPTVELDQILDFSTAEGDRIALNTIDAIPAAATTPSDLSAPISPGTPER